MIPNNVKKTIQNIKEIAGNHSDDDIYAMLKECSMDPNETTQKLLHQDTFHEVKRRRDKKKETNQAVDLKWKPGAPGQGGRGGRGNYVSRHAAEDTGFARNTPTRNESVGNQAFEKTGSSSSTALAQEASKDSRSSVTVMAYGPVGVVVSGGSRSVKASEVSAESVTEHPEMSSPRQLHFGASKRSSVAYGGRDARGKMGGKSYGVGRNQIAEAFQPSLLPTGGSSSRPLSNYGSRQQPATGSQKVGPNKEWKPKTSANTGQGHKVPAASNGSNVSAETFVQTHVENPNDTLETNNKLQEELENLHVKETQHVIIPDHIHVPESVRTGLSFGSFESTFVVTPNRPIEPENQENVEPVSEAYQGSHATEQATSENHYLPVEVADNVDDSQSTEQVSENVSSSDVGVYSTSLSGLSDSKKEITDVLQHSSVPASSSCNFGLIPAVLSNSLGALETSETEVPDVSIGPSLVVQQQQTVDLSSFYAQTYRSVADNDGHAPFPTHGVASKYNGNVVTLSSQTSQSPPEVQGGISLVLSTAAQTPLATQAAGVMPCSVAVTQQPMPLFRQPPGVHLPHYPPNYIPYGHYFSPFFVPPPAMHQFLGNNAFPPQDQAGSVYPGPAGAAAIKYPLSQYKPGSIAGNPALLGVDGSYGPYVAPSASYGPGSATTARNSTTNEDLAAVQFKENNMYITGQQTEGSAVWIPAPGREMASLPANSFYNLPPQGQHVTFAPTQAGHGRFASIYHPAQTVTAAAVHPLLQQSQAMPGVVDMVGATASVYQQSQHGQMNWRNNY